VLRYSDKVFDLKAHIRNIRDGRVRPRIKTSTVISSILVMLLARMGSFNALEQTKSCFFWRKDEDEKEVLPSADTAGNVTSVIDLATVRLVLKQVYARRKRNKSLEPLFPKFGFAVIMDGHESSASYKRCCCGCLHRKVETEAGTRIQFYHRHVTAVLLHRDGVLLLDLEMQRPGEDEVAAATRLLERLFQEFPRAFRLVIADGLYARAPFFKLAKDHRKDVIAVLKDDRRDLFQDAMGLFKQETPVVFERDGGVTCECWDSEGFTSWPQLGLAVRVVWSRETKTVKSQLTGLEETRTSDWVWVTTLPKTRVETKPFVTLGHKRWDIENKSFNELVNGWHADHVYKHCPTAIEACWLLTMLAYNLFEAFINLNLKAFVRKEHTKEYFARLIAAELYGQTSGSSPP
jgi:Transposase DDE domain